MTILGFLQGCFSTNNSFPQEQDVLYQDHTASSTALSHYQNFFSRAVQSSQELDSLLAIVSHKLKAKTIHSIYQMGDICDEIASGGKDSGSSESDEKVGNTYFAREFCDTNAGGKESKAVNEYGAEEEEECDEYQERWGPILAIPDSAFVKLIQRLTSTDNSLSSIEWQVAQRLEGTYNHAVIVHNGQNGLIVKVPVVGTKDRWHASHGEILRSEAHTMTYIKQKLPSFPIANIIAHDVLFKNEINAPYIVQTLLEGKPSNKIWYEQDDDGNDISQSADCLTNENERVRITFLQSLAKIMAELSQLALGGIGMLQFQDGDVGKPVIGPFYTFDEQEDDPAQRVYWNRPVYTTAEEYYTIRLNGKFFKNDKRRDRGVRMILDSVFKSSPFVSSKKHDHDEETFTFLHPDLGFQNILVSSSGEVTGIIDWDGVSTVPCCVGSSTVPTFLQQDWEAEYEPPMIGAMSPWRINKYRKVYAEAMVGACGLGLDTNAKYTMKSGMYGTIQEVVFGDNSTFYYDVDQLIPKLLLEVPELRRFDVEAFEEKLGNGGWKEGERALKAGMSALMNPSDT